MIDQLRARWTASDLEYLRLLATTLLALVILPLAILHFLLDPLDVAERAISHQVP